MIAGVLCVLSLVQGLAITASAGADRDRVAVGEELTFTVYARAEGPGTVTLITPSFDGFDVVQRSERREVGRNGARSQAWEFRLKARTLGHYTLGPVQVVQGGIVAQAPGVDVEVLTDGAGIASEVSSRVRDLLIAAPPPSDTGPAVTVILSGEQVLVGQQVDVLTAAWFPRDLRLRLRRQPTLEPPTFAGVWSYPQPVPPGIAATKRVGNVWYDLFIYHQVIFPITPGPLDGTPAVLRFSVPVAFQFFSQEDRYELKSTLPRVGVLPLPEEGRPAGFDGAVGSALTLTREVDGTPRAGEPVGVRFVLSGRGNVALWPPPFLRWPEGTQVYPEGTEEKLDAVGGVLGGTKTFRYLVVPDSAGVLPIPTVTYHYFDPVPATYRHTDVAGLRIPVAAAVSAVASRAEPPPLLHGDGVEPAWRWVRLLPWWGWLLVWLILPAWFAVLKTPRVARIRAERHEKRSPWVEAQVGFDRALAAALQGGATDPSHLDRALREAGADAAFAERVVAVRDRLGAERFAATGGSGHNALLAEVHAVTAALARLARRGRGGVMAALVGVLLLGAAVGEAQQVPAERLYETRAYRAAMEAFAIRAAAHPDALADWYGLGAAAYRIGDDGQAVAAWTRAARLAPRSRTLARAMLLVPAPDPATAEWRRVPPFTGAECFVVATALWIAAWLGVLVSGQWRGRWAVVAAGALVAAAVGVWSATEARRPLGILTEATPLRVSPHGRAPGSRDLPVGTAVAPQGKRPGWYLVRSATGEVGWVASGDVAWVQE
ncbi:MAG TPA: BatD family protein [Gemmatimonadales bacterium]|nr:BatD family protein [Gemmatimonadales bacterium]